MAENTQKCQMNRKKLVIIIVVVVVVVVAVAITLGVVLGRKKPKSFKDTFLQRCKRYREKIYGQTNPKLDCQMMEREFSKAMNAETCKADVFDNFMKLAITPQMYKKKMTTLWTGSKASKKAEALFDAGKLYVPIARVLGGYIMGDNKTCEGPQWKPYKSCKTCGQEPVEDNFWLAASKRFAALAEGIVNVFIFRNRDPVIRNSSFLISVELPRLRKSVVTGVRVFVFDERCDTNSTDRCQKSAVQDILMKKLTSLGFPSNCSSCTTPP